MTLSGSQVRVLGHIAAGRPIYDHCKTKSDWGGLAGTMASLLRHGLIEGEESLTEIGREALANHENQGR